MFHRYAIRSRTAHSAGEIQQASAGHEDDQSIYRHVEELQLRHRGAAASHQTESGTAARLRVTADHGKPAACVRVNREAAQRFQESGKQVQTRNRRRGRHCVQDDQEQRYACVATAGRDAQKQEKIHLLE